jgi:alpha-glucosidase (family GH31 glycosyl hydrolase)
VIPTVSDSFLLREISSTRREGDAVVLAVRAVRCVAPPGGPGYLTGEPLADQGIESTLPNLPDLDPPPLEARDYELRLSWAAPPALRLTIGPRGARPLADDGTWLGIVTDPRPEPTSVSVEETDGVLLVASPRVRVRLRRRPFALAVEDTATGEVLLRTAERLRQVTGVPMAPAVLVDASNMTLNLELAPSEDILGFGEQFGRLVKNGQLLRLRAEDAQGTGTGMAYKPVPVWHSTDRFGDRREFVAALERLGTRLSVWELPYLDPASPRHAEAAEKGFLVRRASGELASVVRTPSPDGRPRALLDFTNPAARAWWQSLHEPFLDDGVAVFKTDFGEGLPDDAALADGTPPNHAHNLYPLRYNGAVSQAIARRTGRNPLVWGRSAWAGSQRYPGQWGGDAESTVAGMQATLRGGLSYALSAPGFWSHDIGGFFGPELTPELYVRWTQLGALSPLMRAHGLRPREPWAFGERALEIARRWVRLRYQLLPYLWQVAHESASRGWPMLRPLGFEFPDDRIAQQVDDAFLLGSHLLVVPVFDDGPGPARRTFYVPDGTWTDWFTGGSFEGPRFHVVDAPLEVIPLLVRDRALVPTSTVDETVRRTDDLVGRPWTLVLFGAADDDVEAALVGFDGTVTQARVTGTRVSAEGTQPIAEVRRAGCRSTGRPAPRPGP